MNRIYLDKLCEFTTTTYKNYQISKEKDWNLNEQIETIKQNLSFNEKGIVNKFNYVDLNWIIPNIEYNELVLLYPLCFNVSEHYEWNYLLNSLLIILNDEYLYKSNVNKKVIIDTFDKTYKKKITIGENLFDEQIEKIAKLTNISLIILSFDNQINIYNKKDNNDQKYLVLFKNLNEYYPVINWNTKFYKYSDYFIKYLIEFIQNNKKNKKIKDLEENNNKENIKENNVKEEIIETKPKIKKTKSNVSIQENLQDNYSKKTNDKLNEFYEEVINNNENYALYISEAIDPKDISSSTSKKNDNDIKKKTKKNSKDIFVTNKEINDYTKKSNKDNNVVIDDLDNKKVKKTKDIKDIKDVKEIKEIKEIKDIQEVIVEDSVFKQTEKITKNDIIQIKNSLKPSLTLIDLQATALKLSINIVEGSTKTGKPKNKTKSDLFEEIEKYIKDYEN